MNQNSRGFPRDLAFNPNEVCPAPELVHQGLPLSRNLERESRRKTWRPNFL